MISPARTKELLATLRFAENRFGPRVHGWAYKPVLVEGANYPETLVNTKAKSAQVRITESTKKYPDQAAFQLAHEAIHCLAPVERRDTIWFEEGLANHFSLTYGGVSQATRVVNETIVPELFREPLEAFRKLNPTDEKIRSMRIEEPVFDNLTPKLIQKHCGADQQLARQLCQRLPLSRPSVM